MMTQSIGVCGPLIGYRLQAWTQAYMHQHICDGWPLCYQTYGYLPIHKVSPSFDQCQISMFVGTGTHE